MRFGLTITQARRRFTGYEPIYHMVREPEFPNPGEGSWSRCRVLLTGPLQRSVVGLVCKKCVAIAAKGGRI